MEYGLGLILLSFAFAFGLMVFVMLYTFVEGIHYEIRRLINKGKNTE